MLLHVSSTVGVVMLCMMCYKKVFGFHVTAASAMFGAMLCVVITAVGCRCLEALTFNTEARPA